MATTHEIGIRLGMSGVSSVMQGARQVNSAIGSIGSAAQRATGLLTGMVAGAGLVGVFSKISANTIQAEREQSQLAAALQATGNAAGYSQGRLNEMASALEGLTTFAAGDINQAQTVLLGFTNITGQQLPKALQRAADFATRTGVSIASAAETMGRALDIPSVGMASLQRQGFKFSESQIAMARELEKTGRVAEAQQLVFDALDETYGGAAVAARDTYGGAITALKNTINGLLTGTDGSLEGAKEAVNDLNDTLSSPQTKEAFETLIGAVARLSGVLVEGVAEFANFGTVIARTMADLSGNLTPLDKIEGEIQDVDRALNNSFFGRPTKYLTTSREELEAIRATLVKQREALGGAAIEAKKLTSAMVLPDMTVRAPGAINLKDGDKKTSGKSQAEKDYETGQRFLKTLEQQAFKTQERSAWEQLNFDLQNKELRLTGAQLDRAQGLATAIDMARDAEQQRAAEIDRQNQAFALQNSLLQQQSGYQLALDSYGLSDRAASDMRERVAIQARQQEAITKMVQEHAEELRRVEGDAARERLQAQFEDRLAMQQAAQQQELQLFDASLQERTARERNASLGLVAGIRTWVDEAQDAYGQMKGFATNAMSSMEDALTSFATTGKLSFSDMARSIIADLVRIQIHAAAAGILGNLSGLFGAKTTGSSIYSLAGSGSSGLGLKMNAKGDVYNSPSLSSYRNQIHDTPQFFAFARGGVFAEAGAEAIMPLTRGADGNLGVRATGAGTVVNIYNQTGAQVEQTQRRGADGTNILDVVIKQAVNAVAGQLASDSGAIGQAMRARVKMGM